MSQLYLTLRVLHYFYADGSQSRDTPAARKEAERSPLPAINGQISLSHGGGYRCRESSTTIYDLDDLGRAGSLAHILDRIPFGIVLLAVLRDISP